ncbi:Dam family site-specific DNA-(adenine-N6)-methyltransferase [Paraburkholderia sp. BL6665CI2N2]|uniref:DNA adenine methylase n=1 Tax=Paraburkholderia sp. BL6665CI2N2 TaxID=1938806 RepID=UPI00141702F1|nr:Dam family site-specific DNA-(adenine-N6)-methyltransferase [Paraburkholderia sp. BL6665CI2N2]
MFQAARPAKPFLKWVGGKTRVLHHIIPRLPAGRRLIEPFVGGGAVFLATGYEEYLLGDANVHLVELFQAVSENRDEFIRVAEQYFNEQYRTAEQYLSVRSAFNHEQDAVTRAAQFLYLNRHGFNGLCRYNNRGGFNTPYGHPARVPRFPREEIVVFSEHARRAKFVSADFSELMDAVRPDDVVYCDPPYLDRDGARSFTGYGPGGFDMQRQEELASIAKRLVARGVTVLISNHDCEKARQLYVGAEIFSFTARRSVSAAADKRGEVGELLAVFSPK